jgi:hypothetical protein
MRLDARPRAFRDAGRHREGRISIGWVMSIQNILPVSIDFALSRRSRELTRAIAGRHIEKAPACS